MLIKLFNILLTVGECNVVGRFGEKLLFITVFLKPGTYKNVL